MAPQGKRYRLFISPVFSISTHRRNKAFSLRRFAGRQRYLFDAANRKGVSCGSILLKTIYII
jgi:hypothetical protein